MGWTLKDTLSLTPRQCMLIQDALTDILKKENGVEDKSTANKAIMDAQKKELSKSIQELKSKGLKRVTPEQLFGLLARK